MASFSRHPSSVSGIIGLFTVLILLAGCTPISLSRRALEEQAANLGPMSCYGADAAPAVANVDPWTLVEGTWAQRQITQTVATAPMLGDIRMTATTYLRLEISPDDDGRMMLRGETCSVSTSSDNDSVRSIIPEAFVASLGAFTREVVAEPADPGARIYMPPASWTIGARFADPEGDPMLEDVDDPRIYDQDGDGNPGSSIQVEGFVSGSIYVAQRNTNELCGYLTSADTFDGNITWRMEQFVLGASSFLLDRQTNAVVDPTLGANRFATTRIDPDMTCDDIVAQSRTLFMRP